jgi:hypothetical protein
MLIEPIDNLIEMNYEHNVDMLSNVSMSSNANSIKYASAYDDFDINGDYNIVEEND